MGSISDYYDGMDAIIEDAGTEDVMKISPSAFDKFFGSTSQWYNEEVEKNEKAFKGSTSTYLGTIVHYMAELEGLGHNQDSVEADVAEFLEGVDDPDSEIDFNVIKSLYGSMGGALVQHIKNDNFTIEETEKFMFEKAVGNVYVGGTCDALVRRGDGALIVRDYKTASSKPRGITYQYKLQAYLYAWMLTKQGHDIQGIELLFCTRPTKTLPVRTFSFEEPFTTENYKFIDSLIKLVAESVIAYKTKPELRYLLAQDMRLKLPTQPTSFPMD